MRTLHQYPASFLVWRRRTFCRFPMHSRSPSANDNEGLGIRSKSVQKYQNDILYHLKAINVDINTVGYFISTNLGKLFNINTIETLLSYQASNPNAVLIVNDVSQTLASGLSLHAYRLSESFIAARKEGKFTTESLTKNSLSYHNILISFPLKSTIRTLSPFSSSLWKPATLKRPLCIV